jgi:hypothetical protein
MAREWDRIAKAAWSNSYRGALKKLPRNKIAIASQHEGGKTVLTARTLRGRDIGQMNYDRKSGEIGFINTKPGYRRKGVASALMHEGSVKRGGPIKHSTNRSAYGDAFARSSPREATPISGRERMSPRAKKRMHWSEVTHRPGSGIAEVGGSWETKTGAGIPGHPYRLSSFAKAQRRDAKGRWTSDPSHWVTTPTKLAVRDKHPNGRWADGAKQPTLFEQWGDGREATEGMAPTKGKPDLTPMDNPDYNPRESKAQIAAYQAEHGFAAPGEPLGDEEYEQEAEALHYDIKNHSRSVGDPVAYKATLTQLQADLSYFEEHHADDLADDVEMCIKDTWLEHKVALARKRKK